MSRGARQPPLPFDHHRGARPLLRQTSTLRGMFFVGANLVGFVGANAFLYYLSTGRWLGFTVGAYRRALAVSLNDILVGPLGIFSHPWMILVAGLLLAAILFIPTMVAVLYRLWVSALFVLAVAVFAHSPVLAACLAVGCVVAGRTRLRSDMPFLALMAGLLSVLALYVILYYLFFARGPARALLSLQRPVFYLPFILALVSVVLAGASVLGLARLTRYRPGVIWPALLVLVAAPVWLFFSLVGPAELDYALIAARVGPGDAIFSPESLQRPPRSSGAPESPPEPDLPAAEQRLNRRRADLSRDCSVFLRRRPASARGAPVAWVLASLHDVRIDRKGFARGLVRCVYVGPSARALDGWRDLAEAYPGSPQASLAHYRMAVVALRQERVRKGWERLHIARSQLMTHLEIHEEARSQMRLWRRVFIPLESLPGTEYCRAVLGRVRWLIWLMQTNEILEGTPEDIRAFAEYMKLWPTADVSRARLEELAAGNAKTQLGDNFRLRAAMALEGGLERADALSALASEVNDSAVVANYELGRLAMRFPDKQAWAGRKLKTAQEYFKVVVNAPENPYRAPAEEFLAWLARRKGTAP